MYSSFYTTSSQKISNGPGLKPSPASHLNLLFSETNMKVDPNPVKQAHSHP